jgi:hypothetical protein
VHAVVNHLDAVDENLRDTRGAAPARASIALAKEGILECFASMMRYVQNLREFGFSVQTIQQRVFVDIGSRS